MERRGLLINQSTDKVNQMTKRSVSTRRAKATADQPKPRIVKIRFRPFGEIESFLNQLKCELTCASLALNNAQDHEDYALGATDWSVIKSCVERLDRLENDLDSWHVSHTHEPKAASNA